MDRTLSCECGFEVVGTEEDVIVAAQAHAWRSHGMELSTQMARSLFRRREVSRPAEGGLER